MKKIKTSIFNSFGLCITFQTTEFQLLRYPSKVQDVVLPNQNVMWSEKKKSIFL